MSKVAVYNIEGKETSQMELSDAVFAVKAKNSVIQQVYRALRANARQPWAHVKDRGEVRGGGAKPWRQKGTGRARHGSIRSPIWSGGGVTFGPRNTRNYTQKINTKMNRTAVKMCFSDKVKHAMMFVVDGIDTAEKTKTVTKFLQSLPVKDKSTLLIVSERSDQLYRATKNIEGLDVRRALDVNPVDLLHHQIVVITKDGVATLEKRLA